MKFRQPQGFKITPVRRTMNGTIIAPSMIVDASKHEDAVKKARHISGLGRFESWDFV